MDFRNIQLSKQFLLEGKNEKLCYTNTERSGEEDEDASFDEWFSSLEIARKTLQISEKWEQQNFQPSGNSSNEQDNLAAKQVIACSSEDAPWKTRDQEMWQFATSKLENYGFYESHCVQALICTDGDLEDALEMLFYKYYNIKAILKIEDSEIPSAVELLKIRQGEKQKLETMFYDAFLEKIENRVWVLQLELRYLISSTPAPEDSYFTLEIRFPKECIYPYEPPYIYFYKNKGTFPRIKCLRIARRLHNEALLYSLEGVPSIYSVISLLKNENEIQVHLKENREPFLQPFESLYKKRREMEEEYMREFVMHTMEQEKEHIINYCKSLHARELKKEEEKEEEINCYLLESSHIKNREENEEKEKEDIIAPYVYQPLFARGQEKREENMINHVLELSNAGTQENKEEMANLCVYEPLYAREQETGTNMINLDEFGTIERNKDNFTDNINVTSEHITKKNDLTYYHMNMPEELEKREENMFDPHVLELSYIEQSEKREENIINPNELMPTYIEESEKKEKNMFNSKVFMPSYREEAENREGNILNSHIVEPLHAEESEKQERNMIDSHIHELSHAEALEQREENIISTGNSSNLIPSYVGKEKREENIFNSHLFELPYVELEKKEENIFDPNTLVPLYQEEPKKQEGNMIKSDILEPLYVEGSEKREKNIIHPNVVEPLNAEEPEKQERNTIDSHIHELSHTEALEQREENIISTSGNSSNLIPSYVGKEKREGNIFNSHIFELPYVELEKREENIFNPNTLVPLYQEKPKKQEGNMIKSDILEPLYVEGSEKREKNMINPNVLVPPYAKKPENREENMFNSLAIEPLYVGGLRKREENIINSKFVPSYVGESQKTEGNMFNPNVFMPLYTKGPERFNSHVKPLYAEGPKKREGNIINTHVLEPSYVRELSKREEIMFHFNIRMLSFIRELENRERSMFNFYLEPLYAGGSEKLGRSMANPYIFYEPLCAGKKEGNMFNPNGFVPAYAGGPERREGNIFNLHVSSVSSDLTNRFESVKKYKNITFHTDEEYNLIKETFMNRTKDPKYIEMQKVREKLPAWSQKDEILEAIHKNQVVIVSGETGCGKSTQVPQFILDDWIINRTQYEEKLSVNIMCTQPHKISTIALAERAAAERTEKVGDVVGYHIRLERKVSNKTRLTFCTIGILLQTLIGDPNLTDVTHVIVDEVHERSAESDFLLMLLKDLLPKRPLKVILMSATLNADVFSSYFGVVPVLNILGNSFSVEQIFLEDALEKTGYILDEDSKLYICTHKKREEVISQMHTDLDTRMEGPFTDNCIPKKSTKDENLTVMQLINRYPNYSKQTYKYLYLIDYGKINYDLIEHILEWIIDGNHDYPKEGSILIFLPGLNEIITLMDQLGSNFALSNKIMIVPLHSCMSNEEQRRAFQKTENGVTKVVISTNLAETSITINDCVFVIDSGRMKESRFNSEKNMICLQTCWVTRANVVQRKGRAGRVMSGVCIHLYTSHSYEHFAARQIPEILRISLESLLLYIELMHGGRKIDLYAITKKMLDAPSSNEITGAIKRLQDVGALDSQCRLTSLGHHLAKLPVNVRIGKLILFGAIFCCLDSVLTIAACISYKSPFSVPIQLRDKIVNPKLKFCTANSDYLTILQAYNEWKKVMYYCGKNAGKNFAKENYLSMHTLHTLAGMKYQFLELLVSIGFVPINLPKRQPNVDNILIITGDELNKNNSNYKLLQGLICAALYPNIAKLETDVIGCSDPRHIVTRSGSLVKIHPSSVNFQVKFFSSPFLAYQMKLKTSQVFIVEVSMIPILAVILFSGYELSTEFQDPFHEKCTISLANNWIKLTANGNAGYLLHRIKNDLEILLNQKMRNPQLNLSTDPAGKQIIDMIIHAITNW